MTTKKFESVWDALADTPEEAANMKVRADLMVRLQDVVREMGVSQTVAAERLGITQPRLSDLVNGRISKFSIDALVNILAHVGRPVHLEPEPPTRAARA